MKNLNEIKLLKSRIAELNRRIVEYRKKANTTRSQGVRVAPERKQAESGEMSDDQYEFMMAMAAYKEDNHRNYPTWTEALEVLKSLGYRKESNNEMPATNPTSDHLTC